ncbi:MAG: hypothetical protein MZV70_36545 [Desulfobacterales bacterium]|nr:hypothetical protein [Desulfobacterales bacterium]
MKDEKDYIRDIAEIREMMERSSKFLSLSGWAGIMAGIYALSGAYIAYKFMDFNPERIFYNPLEAELLFSSFTKGCFFSSCNFGIGNFYSYSAFL